MGASIFLSHAGVDFKSVDRLANALRNRGFNPLLLDKELHLQNQPFVGSSIPGTIQQFIDQADYVGVWLTPAAIESSWVTREWQAAISKNVEQARPRVLPLLAEGEAHDIPLLLKPERFADFRGSNWQKGLDDLLATLQQPVDFEPSSFKAVVLAGGLATRLWPLTKEHPKALLRVAGKSILEHTLAQVRGMRGLSGLIVCVDESKRDFFVGLEHQVKGDLDAEVLFHYHKSTPSGFQGPVEKLGDLLDHGLINSGDEQWTLVIGADNVITFSLPSFVAYAQGKQRTANALIEQRVTQPEFGVASTDGVELRAVAEKLLPDASTPTQVSTACYAFIRNDVALVPEYLAGTPDSDNLGEFISWLCDRSKVVQGTFGTEWADIGTREGLIRGNGLLLRSLPRQDRFVTGRFSIREPVYLEEGVRIENSVVGPNVYLGKNCLVRDSVVSDSVIYEGCTVDQCSPFRGIVAGRNSHFEGAIGPGVFGPSTKFSTLAD